MAASAEKKKKIRHILIGSGIGTLAIGGFLLWYFKFRKGVQVKDPNSDLFHKLSETNNTIIEHVSNGGTNNPTPVNSSFPLQKGSQGSLVKQLQQALISNYGKSILPKYGADGGFGSETITALRSKGFPSVIDQDTFNKIVSGNANNGASNNSSTDDTPIHPSIEQPIDIAKNIWQNAKTKNLEGLISELQRINNVKDYVVTNTLFKTLHLRGVRQTIVNAALSTFSDDTAKEQISNEFLRIGLKENNGKWSLAGFEKKQVITTQATAIHNMEGVVMEVPADTLLGTFLAGTEDATAFSTLDNETLYVPTKHVSHV